MKKSFNKLFFAKSIVSLGGVGFIKPASATWGSLFAMGVLYYVFPGMMLFYKCLLIGIIFCLGVILADYLEKQTAAHDPHFVVIDEFVGMMITTILLPQNVLYFFIAFILFRFFDIGKFYPASIFDKKTGGFAAMIDDVIMAIPAFACIQIFITLI